MDRKFLCRERGDGRAFAEAARDREAIRFRPRHSEQESTEETE